jgi:Domain of unknown function (DUF4272)
MAREPITIYSSRIDPDGVRRAILDEYPDAEVTGRGAKWSRITVTFGKGTKSKSITFRHDPDYYGGPGWSTQMNGMKAYFADFRGGNRVPRALALIGTLKFALATEFDPDFDPDGEERLDLLIGVTRMLDGVLFTPSTLRDASGRIILSTDGEHDEEVTWPKTTPVVPMAVELPGAGDGPAPRPPSAARVARRVLALTAVTARAVIERDHGPKADSADKHAKLLRWVADVGIEDELEDDERKALRAKPGKLDGQTAVNCMWRIEGLGVLLWALRRYELPRYDTLVNIDDVWTVAGFLRDPGETELIRKAKLRPAKELDTFRKQMLGYHWRLRDFQHVKQEPMDFRAFAKKCWFGSFDARPFELIDKDLALQGQRIDRADPAVFQTACSLAVERHLAINWLCWGPDVYSEADVST